MAREEGPKPMQMRSSSSSEDVMGGRREEVEA